MPRAVIDVTETRRFDLKSLPDGYVVLRRLTYGQWLQRQEDSLSMSMERSKDNDALRGVAQMATRKVALWEFSNCIVEHNLEGNDGQMLDFKKEYTLDILDPKVGQEIGNYIQEMNSFDDVGN